MSKYRRRRNKLKSHDSGFDRHAKGVAWMRKQARAGAERSRITGKRSRSQQQENT